MSCKVLGFKQVCSDPLGGSHGPREEPLPLPFCRCSAYSHPEQVEMAAFNRSPEQSDEGRTAKKQVASAEEESKEIHESTVTPQALPEVDGRSHGRVREEGGGTMDSSSQK